MVPPPVTSSSTLAGYRLYYGQDSLAGAQSLNVETTTTYTLPGLVEGQSYTFAVTAYDTANHESGYSNIVTATIPVSNHAPTALGDTASDTAGTPVTIAVLANDTDPDGNPLTIATVTNGAHGTVTISGNAVVYTPAANFSGTDQFTYTIQDGQDGVATGTVVVTVAPANGAPSAVNDTVTIPTGTTMTITVLTNDSDPNGAPLSIAAVTQGAHGTVTANGMSVTYTPVATFIGQDQFTYTIADGQGGSSTATVTVMVLPDRAASLVAAYSFNEGSGNTVNDASGYHNQGTLSRATRTTPGKFGRALVFNGRSALVTIPDAPSLRLTTAMTLEAWVKPSKVTSAWRDVIEKGNDDYLLEATTPTNSRPGGGGTLAPPSP